MTSEFSKLKKRAERGDVSAQSAVATSYALGDGVRADLVLARYWYSQAAEQGDAEACFNFAAMILHGEGGTKSKRKANALMRKASLLGSGDASVWIGETAMQECKDEIAVTYFARALVQGDIRGARGISLLLSRSRFGSAGKWGDLIARELKKGGVKL
ncbi:SEL1-like repeat protein [Xanthomonas sacchari]|uniref:tetratricopeptide repeat protein n=1 Tax=Xanthomonas TaxID=338 RepID=UPI0009DA282F|nr:MULTISPECIES: SEL1-like repeat protein [Xanthomonas]UYK67865.1 SEL1-like repeat protein [Xanthomonas sacchari]